MIRDVLTGEFKVPENYKIQKDYHLYRNNYNWSQFLNSIQDTNNTAPKFVYTHLMLPHGPYYLKRDGSLVSDTSIIKQDINKVESYLEQLRYTNTLLKDFFKKMPANSKRERVIIIQGDHGLRELNKSFSKDVMFMNLNTYYFSDLNYNGLYDGISPVNTFRVVLNKYFCMDLPLLKDSSIFLETKKSSYF